MSKDIVRKKKQLPSTIDKLEQYVVFSKARHKVHLAKLAAIKDIPDAKGIQEEVFRNMLDDLADAWAAHARLGEMIETDIIKGRPQKFGNDSKLSTFDLSGDDSRFARGFYHALQEGFCDKAYKRLSAEELNTRRFKPPKYYEPYNDWLTSHKTSKPKEIKTKIKPIIELTDCIDFLDQFSDGSIDLLLTDPPYMTDIPDLENFVSSWLSLALSKIKDTGRAYIFIGSYPKEIYLYLTELFSQDRFLIDVLSWTYRNTLGPSPVKDYKRNWQAILYLRTEESPNLNCPKMTEQFSVQDISAPDGRRYERYSEWQKPDEIAERFIRHSTKEEDIIIDPFAGTGTFLLAAGKLNRQGYGCDTSKEIIKIAIKRGCKQESASNYI